MNERIFITGGVGFIGSRLAECWTRAGGLVTVFDSFHPQVASIHDANRQRLAELGVDIIKGDVRNRTALDTAIQKAKPDIVYHLAAETGTGQSYDMPAQYTDVNVSGTANLVEALRTAQSTTRRVILAGSRAVYGEGACVDAEGRPALAVARKTSDLAAGDFAPKDTNGNCLIPVATNASCLANPSSIYASTKLMQEYLLLQGFWGSETEVGILRLQNVYGPGQALRNPYTGVLSIFAQQVAEERTLEIYEDGEITRDFVFIDDVVSAFHRVGTVGAMPDGIIDIGSGMGTTILDVAKQVPLAMGKDVNNLRISGKFRPGDIRHAIADIARATDKLGWRPTHSLSTGIAQLTAWLAETAVSSADGRSEKKTLTAAVHAASDIKT